jgi:uncharacterized protein (DUF2062 family)
LNKRINAELSEFLQQGTSPKTLAVNVAVGVGLGIVPLLGVATLLCTMAAILFRLNLRAVQLTNIIVLPLQLVLVLPFAWLGARMSGRNPISLYPSQLLDMLQHDLFRTLRALQQDARLAIEAWMFVVPVVVALIYFFVNAYLASLAKDQEPLPVKARAAAASR